MVHVKVWEMMMEEFNWRVKSGLLSQTEEKRPVGTFEGCGNVAHRPQKNVRDKVKKC